MGQNLTELNKTRYLTLGCVAFGYLAGYLAWGDLGWRWLAAALIGLAVLLLEERHRKQITTLEADLAALRAQLVAAPLPARDGAPECG